jgi:uncharacterized membrane protein
LGPWEIHPALVHFPIAFLMGGVALDLYAAWRGRPALALAASQLIVAGVLTGIIAAVAGVLAFFTVPGMHAEWAHQAVLWHLGLAGTSLVLLIGVALGRRGEAASLPSLEIRLLGILAVALLAFAAAIGGQVVYRAGMGIDPSAVIVPTGQTSG